MKNLLLTIFVLSFIYFGHNSIEIGRYQLAGDRTDYILDTKTGTMYTDTNVKNISEWNQITKFTKDNEK